MVWSKTATMGARGYPERKQVRRASSPPTTRLLTYVVGGTLGFLMTGVVFFPLYRAVGLGLMLFSLLYLVSGVLGFWLWCAIDPCK
jgi:thiamine transporter ThiT